MMRTGFINLFLLSLYLTLLTPAATIYTITLCNESAFDAALASARTGGLLRFDCTGTIEITVAKTISRDITIEGGQHVSLVGKGAKSILVILSNASVTMNGLTLTGANGEGRNGAVENRGALKIVHSTIIQNAQAIYNGRDAILHVSDSVISSNEHGILNYGGTVTVNKVTFADNVGDGIYNSRKLTVIGSTFTGNTHGIDNGSGDVIIANSMFYANKARKGQMGAGIANSGTMNILNSTFLANEAEGSGAAVGNRSQGRITLQNTVIANSLQGLNCLGAIIDGGNNIQFPGTSCGTSITAIDPQIIVDTDSTLQLLVQSSPIVGMGNTAICKTDLVGNVDLRGQIRITSDDFKCDIGAFEITTGKSATLTEH
jgi:hypothetical protein